MFHQESTVKREATRVKTKTGKNISFRLKLTLSYFILVLLPIVIVGFFSYNIALEALKKHTNENLNLTSKQINDNIEYKLKSITSIAEYMFNDLAFQKALSKQYSDSEGVDLQQYLRQYMVPLINLPVTPNRLFLFVDNSTIPENYLVNKGLEKKPVVIGQSFNIQHLNSVKKFNWYNSLQKLEGNSSWIQIANDKELKSISYIRRLYNLDDVLKLGANNAQLGYICITIKLEDLFDTSQFPKAGKDSYLVVVNSNNDILFSNSEYSKAELLRISNLKEYLVIENKISQMNLRFMINVPVAQLEESAARVRKLSIIVCSISLLFFTLISILLSKHFSEKVSRIVSFINSFRDGEFNKRLKTSNNDELHQISTAMNDMAATINNLIEEIYITNTRKAHAELQVLQSQINPHFLYNTLASVSTLAQLGQVDKLNDVIDRLVSFYRLTLNSGSFIITVENEIQQVKAYIDIKKMQHSQRLNVFYDIEPSILQYKTIKIILQPFVENSLQHGMFMGRKINIRVLAYREKNKIIFKIIDDGVGMPPETLNQILSINENSIGYGIKNVNERIKLQFGKEYGVSIYSRLGIGTTVSIVIPVEF